MPCGSVSSDHKQRCSSPTRAIGARSTASICCRRVTPSISHDKTPASQATIPRRTRQADQTSPSMLSPTYGVIEMITRIFVPALLAVAMLGVASNAHAFKLFGGCGCASAPACCEAAPSCGCDAAPSCGCDMAPSCGCDAAPSCCGHSCGGGLFSGLFAKLKAKMSCCSAPSCCEAAPSCGCDAPCGCEVAPTCGCDAAPSCGCDVAPSCGCDAAPSCCGHSCGGGLFSKLMSKFKSHSCGCASAPSCGCDAPCGCAVPSCGCN